MEAAEGQAAFGSLRVSCVEVGLPEPTSVPVALGSAVALALDNNSLADEESKLINMLEDAVEIADGLRQISSGEDVAQLRTGLVTASEAKARMDDFVSKVRWDLVQLQAISTAYMCEKTVSNRQRGEVNLPVDVVVEAMAGEILEKDQSVQEECRRLTSQGAELTKNVTDQSALTQKCAATVNSAAVVRRYLNKMNEAVENVNLSMYESQSKGDDFGTTIDEAKSVGVGLGFQGASASTRPVAKTVKGPTKLIVEPPKPQAKRGGGGRGKTRCSTRGSGGVQVGVKVEVFRRGECLKSV